MLRRTVCIIVYGRKNTHIHHSEYKGFLSIEYTTQNWRAIVLITPFAFWREKTMDNEKVSRLRRLFRTKKDSEVDIVLSV